MASSAKREKQDAGAGQHAGAIAATSQIDASGASQDAATGRLAEAGAATDQIDGDNANRGAGKAIDRGTDADQRSIVRDMAQVDIAAIEGYDPDEALKLGNQVCFPLYACSKEVVRRYTPYLESLGITYTQYIALMVLWEHDQITVGDLGERLLLDSGTLTPLLKKMEAHGLVKRHRSESDERRVVVTLTQAGRDLKQDAAKVPLAMASCVQLSPEEGAQLVYLLNKVLQNVRASR